MGHQNRLLAGAAILGDGRVGLILDVNALVNLN
jgi:chemotaxis protein histidine kinase CheA